MHALRKIAICSIVLFVIRSPCEAAFTNIISVPPATVPDWISLDVGTQLNLYNGGSAPWVHTDYSGAVDPRTIEINVIGGHLGYAATENSITNIRRGKVDGLFAGTGSLVNISGGTVGNFVNGNGKAFIFGSEFLIDGVPLAGLGNVGDVVEFTLQPQSIISGTLSDGTTFLFNPDPWNTYTGKYKLTRTTLPVVTTTNIRTSINSLPAGLRAGQTLTVDSVAETDMPFTAATGSTINVTSGSLSTQGVRLVGANGSISAGDNRSAFEVYFGGTLTLNGGSTKDLSAIDGSTINVYGGTVNGYVNVDNSQATITAGNIAGGIYAFNGSTVTATGGVFEYSAGAYVGSKLNLNGAQVNGVYVHESELTVTKGRVGSVTCGSGCAAVISGGAVSDISTWDNANVKLLGDDFQIDGKPVSGISTIGSPPTTDVPAGSVFTGTLSDGTPFAMSGSYGGGFASGSLELQFVDASPIATSTFNVPNDAAPAGLRRNQTLNLLSGGVLLNDFVALSGSTLKISGGVVGGGLKIAGAHALVSGGEIGERIVVGLGGDLNVSGTAKLSYTYVSNTGQMTVAGGDVSSLDIGGGQFSMTGGVVNDFDAWQGSHLDLQGGTIKGDMPVRAGADIKARGTTFAKDVRFDNGASLDFSAGRVEGYIYTNYGSSLMLSGGFVNGGISAVENSNVTISGGESNSLYLAPNASVIITGGKTGLKGYPSSIDTSSGSSLRISGGVQGDRLFASDGSHVSLVGGEFLLNGQPVAGLEQVGNRVQLDLGPNSTLVGAYADGTPFAFTTELPYSADTFATGTLTLERASLPTIGPANIVASSGHVPPGIRNGQTLKANFAVGGYFMAGPGSTIDVLPGGQIGENMETIGAVVNVQGGNVGGFQAFQGTKVNITAGSVDGVQLFNGSSAHVSGGDTASLAVYGNSHVSVAGGFVHSVYGQGNSMILITGGNIGSWTIGVPGTLYGSSALRLQDHATAFVKGGAFGDGIYKGEEAHLTLQGGDFRINGQPISGLQNIGDNAELNFAGGLFSGILADGTPFAFSYNDGDYTLGSFQVEVVQLPAVTPRHLHAPVDQVPLGIRGGETLTVEAGGIVSPNFNAGPGSILNLHQGGMIGQNLEADGATVNVYGGDIGGSFGPYSFGAPFGAYNESRVKLHGGMVERLDAINQTSVDMFAGASIGDLDVRSGSTFNMHGGSTKGRITLDESVLNYSGGVISIERPNSLFWQPGLLAFGGTTNIIGTEFLINGLPIDDLNVGVPLTVAARDIILSGVLADGTTFSWFVNQPYGYDFNSPIAFFEGARLTLTLVRPGDYNSDGIVDTSDYLVWRKRAAGSLAADGNFDGIVDALDLDVWRANFGRNYLTEHSQFQPVPEPTAACLWAFVVGALACRRMRLQLVAPLESSLGIVSNAEFACSY